MASLEAGEDRPPPMPLTRREEQISQLIAEGLSKKGIAEKLFLQPQTVKNYVHLILQKLNLRSSLDVSEPCARAGIRQIAQYHRTSTSTPYFEYCRT